MALPDVVSREDWLAAREALLAREKELTKARDALNTQRRELPMVEIDKDYVFAGPGGEVGLLDLFEGRRQLIVYHFMFEPEWTDGCPGCTSGMDEFSDGLLDHLHRRETSFAVISLAPLAKLEDYKARRGWTFRWYSSYGTDFNRDFGVTTDDGERHSHSCFLREGDRIFHTYQTFARGSEQLGGSYYWLDMTALGRQEAWEEPRGRADEAHAADPALLTGS